MADSPVILAVDTSDFDTARAWIDATRESIDIYKLGLEFFLTFGSGTLIKNFIKILLMKEVSKLSTKLVVKKAIPLFNKRRSWSIVSAII